jgi:hypothetical protein
MMQFGKSFTYMFEEDDWVTKILLAIVIAFIPFVGVLAVSGWMVEIASRVIHDEDEKLPDWSGFVDYLIKGLVVILIGFVYMLPFIVVQICGISLAAFTQDAGDAVSTLGAVSGICLGLFALVYAVLVGFLLMAAIGIYADTGEIGAAFRIGEAFKMLKAAPGAYLLVFLGTLLAAFIASLGLILCFIGVFVTATYAQTVIANLYGQAYREAKKNITGDELLSEPGF